MKVVGWVLFALCFAAALITLMATMALYEDGGGFAVTTYIFYLPALILSSLLGMGVGLFSKRSFFIASGVMAFLAAISLFGSFTAPYAKNGDTLIGIIQLWALPAVLGAFLVAVVGFIKHRK